MPGFNVVVADGYGVVAHVCGQPWIQMPAKGIDVVEVVRCIVALKAVSGIDKEDG